jgi:DNA-binding winged helix-turn-helix (wHTH) protein
VRVRFADCVLDARARTLVRGGETLHLTPKAFDVLSALIAERPAVVTKEELHARVWPGVNVSEASLNVAIAEIRRVLGDDASRGQLIRTVPRVGYAFSAASFTDAPRAAASCSANWQGVMAVLAGGENTLGRSRDCRLVVDDDTVSRVHAVIRIDEGARRATLEDHGSTNGTFRRRTRVTTPIDLADGDVIRLGSASVTIRLWLGGTTRTRRQRRA